MDPTRGEDVVAIAFTFQLGRPEFLNPLDCPWSQDGCYPPPFAEVVLEFCHLALSHLSATRKDPEKSPCVTVAPAEIGNPSGTVSRGESLPPECSLTVS